MKKERVAARREVRVGPRLGAYQNSKSDRRCRRRWARYVGAMSDELDRPDTMRSTLMGYAAMGLRLPMDEAERVADMYERLWHERNDALSSLRPPGSA